MTIKFLEKRPSIQVELEFRDVDFCGEPREKPFTQGHTKNKLNLHM